MAVLQKCTGNEKWHRKMHVAKPEKHGEKHADVFSKPEMYFAQT